MTPPKPSRAKLDKGWPEGTGTVALRKYWKTPRNPHYRYAMPVRMSPPGAVRVALLMFRERDRLNITGREGAVTGYELPDETCFLLDCWELSDSLPSRQRLYVRVLLKEDRQAAFGETFGASDAARLIGDCPRPDGSWDCPIDRSQTCPQHERAVAQLLRWACTQIAMRLFPEYAAEIRRNRKARQRV